MIRLVFFLNYRNPVWVQSPTHSFIQSFHSLASSKRAELESVQISIYGWHVVIFEIFFLFCFHSFLWPFVAIQFHYCELELGAWVGVNLSSAYHTIITLWSWPLSFQDPSAQFQCKKHQFAQLSSSTTSLTIHHAEVPRICHIPQQDSWMGGVPYQSAAHKYAWYNHHTVKYF